MNRVSAFLIFLTGLFLSCQSSNLSSNNLYRDILVIARTESPDEDQLSFVKSNYPVLVKQTESYVEAELAGDSRFRWKNSVSAYSRIQQIGSAIRSSGNFSDLTINDYGEKISELQLSAAEDVFNEAREALESGTREGAKVAWFQFLEVDELSKGKIETGEWKQEAMEISRIEAALFLDTTSSTQVQLDSIAVNINSFLSTEGIAGPFVVFVPWNEDLEPDHLLEISLENYVMGQLMSENYTQAVSDSDLLFEIDEQTIDAAFIFRLKITDLALNQIIDNSEIRVNQKIDNLTGSFEGDTDLLNEYQKSILENKKLEKKPDLIFEKIKKPVISAITGEILDFYQNY